MSWLDTANRLTAETMPPLGNVVKIDGVTDWGVLMSPSEAVMDGAVVVTGWMLTIPSAVWPVLAEGQGICVDGSNYIAREESRPGSDQSTTEVPLQRISGDLPATPAEGLLILSGDWA